MKRVAAIVGLGVLMVALAAGVALAVLEVGNNNPNTLRGTVGDNKVTRLSAGAQPTSSRVGRVPTASRATMGTTPSSAALARTGSSRARASTSSSPSTAIGTS